MSEHEKCQPAMCVEPGHTLDGRPIVSSNHDHRALIEAARELHFESTDQAWGAWCRHCQAVYPCLPARLAEALAGVDAELHYTKGWALSAGGSMDYWSGVATSLREELGAAERALAEQVEWRDNVSGALRSWDMFESGEWAGNKDGWGYHFELIRFLIRHYEPAERKIPADGR